MICNRSAPSDAPPLLAAVGALPEHDDAVGNWVARPHIQQVGLGVVLQSHVTLMSVCR